MSSKRKIHRNIVQFKQRYWLARLLQGLLIFCGTGLVFFAVVALLEYAAWLNTTQRALLLIVTSAIELVLVLFYIGYPLLQIFINGRNLSDRKAAEIIGYKLDDVGDKLLNYLELQSSPTNELVDAGIEQKGSSLVGFPFYKAVSFASLKPFLLFLIPPAIVVLYLFVGNRWHMLSEGADRLIHFNTTYQRALPFSFEILSGLVVDEGEDYRLSIRVTGKAIPDQITLETKQSSNVLQRHKGNLFEADFLNVISELKFRIQYDEIRSETFSVNVYRKPVLGRISVEVTPPSYTSIAPFSAENIRELDVPQGSEVRIKFAIKNAIETALLASQGSEVDSLGPINEDFTELKVFRSTVISAFSGSTELVEIKLNVIRDLSPALSVEIDSTAEFIEISVLATDDYGILKSTSLFTDVEGIVTEVPFLISGGIVDARFSISREELSRLKELKILVRDYMNTVFRVIDLSLFAKKELTCSQLLDAAGADMRAIKEKEETIQISKASSRRKDELKKEAEQLERIAKQLTEKDSVQFERFKELSEKINDILKKLDKELPQSQQKLQEQKLEEMLMQLEQEWAILKTVEQLKQMDESLKKDAYAEEKIMKNLEKSEKDLNELLDKEKKEKLDWKKFDELQKANESLKMEENQYDTKQDKGSGDKQKEGEKKEQNSSDKKKDVKDEMKEDSDALKEQLNAMSDAMMMEAMEKNIALLRRLELRALKASLKQEELYEKAQVSQQVDNSLVSSQREVNQATSVILDSLSYVTFSEEQLAQILSKNVEVLSVHLNEMTSMQDITLPSLVSGQRYLQYGLNDLASILYDILKSESQNLQNMMAGSGSCKNPKPGKGRKKSLGQKQKELGEKMGKGKKPGEGAPNGQGKNGRQSLSQGELLEIIKGQEEILREVEKEGGTKAGNKDVIDQLNKQLEDLINNNIDKAINRNKEIEDKLIALEKSQNQKKEDDTMRKSQEYKLDYEAIRKSVFLEYTKGKQSGSGIVNLPALKQYYIAKWLRIGNP